MEVESSLRGMLINLLLALSALLPAAAVLNFADVPCGRPMVRASRVKGGQDAKVGEYPWLVSIRINGGHFCGGSLIHSKFVLTAAHCTQWKRPEHVTVAVGEYDLLQKEKPVPESIMEVVKIYNHESFAKRYIDDIALLELKKPVTWTKNIRPVCIADTEVDGPTDAMDNHPVMVAGWGWTDEYDIGGVRANIMQKAELTVVPRPMCQVMYDQETGKLPGDPQYIGLLDSNLCAGTPDSSRDACQGDSGGPLISQDADGRLVCVGIVSAGIGCGRPNLAGIYTRVSRYTHWIEDTMRSAGLQ